MPEQGVFENLLPRADAGKRRVYQDESPDPLGALNGERIADHIADIMGDEIGLCDLQGVQHPCNVACLRLLVEATGRL